MSRFAGTVWGNWEGGVRRELTKIASNYSKGKGEGDPARLNEIEQHANKLGWKAGIKLKDGSATEYEAVVERLTTAG